MATRVPALIQLSDTRVPALIQLSDPRVAAQLVVTKSTGMT